MTQPDADIPMDLSILADHSDGDKDLEKKLIGIFIRQSDDHVKILGDNRTAGGTKLWRETAHALKGNAASMGAKTLANLCGEAQSFMGKPDQQSTLFTKIEAEYARVNAYLATMGIWP